MTDFKKGDSSKKNNTQFKNTILNKSVFGLFFLQENLLNNKETEFYPLRSRTGIFT